jgi:hypothetical protein
MRLLDFNIDYEDFNSEEQKEISKEYVELCCKAIEDITGIHRSEWMIKDNRDDKVCYAWRNIYFYSLHKIFNLPFHLIAKHVRMSISGVRIIIGKVENSKDRKDRMRLAKIYNYIENHY